MATNSNPSLDREEEILPPARARQPIGSHSLYLNGKEIYWSDAPRGYAPDQDVVTGVELKAGLNVLVFKVVNETIEWLGSVRLTDAAGQPVQGIRVSLAPP